MQCARGQSPLNGNVWSQPHRPMGRYRIAISWIFFHLAFSIEGYNAANLFPFLLNQEAGKFIIFSLVLQFIVCEKKKILWSCIPFVVQRVSHTCARTHNRQFYNCGLSALLGPVHSNAFWKVCVFVIIENSSINSGPHYCFDAFSTVPTKTFENDRASCTLIVMCKLNFMRML